MSTNATISAGFGLQKGAGSPVRVINRAGAAVAAGTVLMLDESQGETETTTAAYGGENSATGSVVAVVVADKFHDRCVVTSGGADNSPIAVTFDDIVLVSVSEAVNPGDPLTVIATGVMQVAAATETVYAKAYGTTAGAGTVLARFYGLDGGMGTL